MPCPLANGEIENLYVVSQWGLVSLLTWVILGLVGYTSSSSYPLFDNFLGFSSLEELNKGVTPIGGRRGRVNGKPRQQKMRPLKLKDFLVDCFSFLL